MKTNLKGLKTLILGLGNPLRSDDGVGNRVAQALAQRIKEPNITVTETNAAGLSLLDLLSGYEQAMIIDAVQTKEGKAGEVYRLDLQDLTIPSYLCSTHDVDLATAMELGKRLGLELPQKITIFAIEVADVVTFSEQLTPEVAQAVPKAMALILQELEA